MIDIDSSLTNLKDSFDVPVDGDFTARVIAGLPMKPKKVTWWPKLQLLPVPALVGVAVFVLSLTAGTVYALGGLEFLNALFVKETVLNDQTRIVEIAVKNCVPADAVDAENTTATEATDAVYYYKVKQGSSLTNQQVTAAVQGNCYLAHIGASLEKRRIDSIMSTPNADGYLHDGLANATITQISPTSVSTFSTHGAYDGLSAAPLYAIAQKNTYQIISPDVTVTAGQGGALTWADLHVGDHVQIGYRSQAVPSAGPPSNDASAIVVTVVKHPEEIGSAFDFALHNGIDYIRVKKCTTDPSGYCELSQRAAFILPLDVTAYQQKTEAINKVTDVYEAALVAPANSLNATLSAYIGERVWQAITPQEFFCQQPIPTRLSYTVYELAGATVRIAVSSQFYASGQFVPQPLVSYDTISHRITAIECRSIADLYGIPIPR